jgi:molybdenum cofactor synthesis domain-containing protein
MAIKVAILTISDKCSEGKRADTSGQTIHDMLNDDRFQVVEKDIVPDDEQIIAEKLRTFSDGTSVDIILTTGGTGLGPRDVTPEATSSVCDRTVPGLGEVIRSEGFKSTPFTVLSRGIAGIRNNTLIVNLPGSPKGVRESLEIILNVLPHAVDMIHGGGH